MPEFPSLEPDALNIVLVAIGSHGDVHPFVGIGIRLKGRGHRVTVVANPHFRSLVERSGLAFRGVGSAEEYGRLIDDPDLWDGMKGTRFVLEKGLIPALQPVYDHIVAEVGAHPRGEPWWPRPAWGWGRVWRRIGLASRQRPCTSLQSSSGRSTTRR